MPGPIQSLRYIHKAIRREAHAIERAAWGLDGPDADMDALARQIEFLARVAEFHTKGEEVGLFPAMEQKIPKIAATYLFDHRSEEDLFGELLELTQQAGAPAKIRRQATVLHEHLRLHIQKENQLIIPLVEEHFTPPEQGAIVAGIVGSIPPEDLRKALPWMLTALDGDEREAYLREASRGMPVDRFRMLIQWAREGLAADVWSDLQQRIPEIGQS